MQPTRCVLGQLMIYTNAMHVTSPLVSRYVLAQIKYTKIINHFECHFSLRNFQDNNSTDHTAFLYLRHFTFQTYHPNEDTHESPFMFGSYAAILFVLLVVVLLFFMHENKLMTEPT